EFIAWARENYDTVIFDTPAAIYIPDIVDFFEHVDGIVVVVRLHKTTRTLLNKIFKILNIFDAKYIGAVLNDFYEGQNGNKDFDYSYKNYYNSVTDKNAEKSKNKRHRKSFFSDITLTLVDILDYLNGTLIVVRIKKSTRRLINKLFRNLNIF
ncbi:MAG: tyrosine-protein kinase family protein, partial [Paludibacter sp.]